MILHSIKVENWRCLLGETLVGPFSERLNVLYAPNATGKSTLFESLRCALMDNHNTRGEDALKLQPWGRELAPRVTVEFTAQGRRYRVRKRFLEGAESVLERMEAGIYRPLAEGPKADAETRQLFTPNGPKKGMSRPEHWGILQVLWAPQGKLELGGLSGDLLSDIRQSLSSQVVDSRTRAFEERLKAQYGIYFTPTGRIRAGAGASSIGTLGILIQEKKGLLEAKNEEYEEADALSYSVKKLSEKLEALRASAKESEFDLRQLEKKADDYQSLMNELHRREGDAKAAEAEYGRLKAFLEQLSDARRELQETERKFSVLATAIPILEKELADCSMELEKAKTEHAQARTAKEEGETLVARAREARRLVELKEKLTKIDGTLAEAAASRTALEAVEAERAGQAFPEGTQISRIRKVFSTLEETKNLLEASLITLEVVPAEDRSAHLESGETLGPVELLAGKENRVKGAPEVCLEIKNFGRIRAFGPCESVEAAREAFEEAQAALAKLAEPYGTTEKADLEELYEKGADLTRRAERENDRLAAILGKDSLESLECIRDRFRQELEDILARFPEWRETAPEHEALDSQARSKTAGISERLLTAESARDKAQEHFSEKGRELGLKQQQREFLETTVNALREKLARLESDGKSGEQRQEELGKLALSWDSARAGAEEYRKRLTGFEEDPIEALRKAREADRMRNTVLQQAETDFARESTRLEVLSMKGLYSEIVSLEETLESLRRKFREETLAADSIKILWDTYSACRSEMTSVVNRAVEDKATKIVSKIAGCEKGRLVLDPSMAPSGFIPGEAGRVVDVEALSGGEVEQVHFAVRLALASATGSEERQLLVLDDTLMATDGIRFPRILDILEEVSENLQVLILTCQSDRFASLAGAKRFDLEAIRAGAL